ncbi:MAG TPA: hypothetical protein VM869_05560 [Enhygromyxa sp.]|nr:hypothetical protein [Enhygromyxa sp.]
MSADTSGVRPVSQTRTSEYYVREDGIIVQSVITPGTLTLDDAKANMRLFEQLADGAKQRLLVEIAAPYRAEPGVREYYASEEARRWIAALAIVTPSIPARLIGGLSLRLNRPGYPCRMFGSIARAAAWLLRQR